MTAELTPEGQTQLPRSRHRLIPALWFSLSVFLFALMIATVKLLGSAIPVIEVIFLRQAAVVLFLLPALIRLPADRRRSRAPGLNILRGLLSVAAMWLGFTGIVALPLAEATTLAFTKCLFVVVLAALFLGERTGARCWIAVSLGFAGAIVALNPTASGLADPMGLTILAAAALAAGVVIIVRRLAGVDAPETIMAWQSLIVLGVVTVPALIVWVTPTLEQTALLLLLGALMYGVQWSSIRAHRDRDAAVLAPLEYTRLIYAAVIGYIVFDTVPDWSTLIAAVLIIGGALIVTWPPTEPADDMSRI